MSIARVYTAPFENIAFGGTANRCFWELKAPSDKIVVIHGFSVTSDHTTDERARLRLARTSTDGSGTAVTEVKTNPGNPNAPGSVVLSASTPGTLGDVLKAWRWSQQGELLYLPTPEMREIVDAGGRIGLELLATLGAARNWSGWLTWSEE